MSVTNTIIAPVESPVKLAYNVTEAAAALGVSRTTIYNLIYAKNDFPYRKLGGKYLIPVRGLDEWINKAASSGGLNHENHD